jgi:hypothetical protein
MDKMNFKKETQRRFTHYYFNQQPIFVGDLVEYKKGETTEIGEVQMKGKKYYIGGTEFKSLSLTNKIQRVISMKKEG